MINGEGAMEDFYSEATFPPGHDPLDDDLLPWGGQKSDDEGENKSSDISSCGESEFERYCSANSALGTPSSVYNSSVYEFADSEFGSFKNFKLEGENKNLKNFAGDKKLLHFSEIISSSELRDGKRRIDDQELNGLFSTSKGIDFYGSSDASLNYSGVGLVENDNLGWGNNDAMGTMENGSSCKNEGIGGNMNVQDAEGGLSNLEKNCGSLQAGETGEGSDVVKCENEEEFSPHNSHRVVELVDGCLEGLDLQSGLEFVDGDVERCSDECETSSGDEHSKGEDSVPGQFSDDVRKANSNCTTNIEYLRGERLKKSENELFMTSAVAFGQDDWDDFMQETRESPLNMMVQDEFLGEKQESAEDEFSCHVSPSTITTGHSGIGFRDQLDGLLDISRIGYQIQGTGELEKSVNTSSSTNSYPLKFGQPDERDVKELRGFINFAEYPASDFAHKNDKMDQNFTREVISVDLGLSVAVTEPGKGNGHRNTLEATGTNDDFCLEHVEQEKMNVVCDPLPDSVVNEFYSAENAEDGMAKIFQENDLSSTKSLPDKDSNSLMENSPVLLNHFEEDHFSPVKREKSELNEFFDETVHEMEEILLDTGKSPGSRATSSQSPYQPHMPVYSRDGGSTASTSGTDELYPLIRLPTRINGVELTGARQKQGDVSLSERLVGVKEFTVYRIRVWTREETWEVEHRYRDFCTLYRQLKKLFHDQGLVLPPPWSSVERESRKIFGNASPDVIAERSILIQECLQSIIHSKMSSSSFSVLIHFLSPSTANLSSPSSTVPLLQPLHSSKGTTMENVSMLGNTVSLVVHLQSYKSLKQLLEIQHYTCAGCHKNFEERKTRMKELVQTLGWGKPRLCEYSGQLFCSSCHNNDTAVLPARVLHLWEFTQYPVSQLSKSYLDSIFDKPMLCVSAVNPLLFSRVAALQHVRNVRTRIRAMLPFVHCSFRRSFHKGLGSRRYLLESNDFFALRDLIDLSKGMFAALPVIVDTVSRKILEHIMEQCLICCDSGIPCNARQACNDPSALIFPFQEGEVERCRSCDSVFHRHCFGRMMTCSCGAHLKPNEAIGLTTGKRHGFACDTTGTLNSARKETETSTGFFSGLFLKAVAKRPMAHEESSEESSNVILMGSLPSTSF